LETSLWGNPGTKNNAKKSVAYTTPQKKGKLAGGMCSEPHEKIELSPVWGGGKCRHKKGQPDGPPAKEKKTSPHRGKGRELGNMGHCTAKSDGRKGGSELPVSASVKRGGRQGEGVVLGVKKKTKSHSTPRIAHGENPGENSKTSSETKRG